MDIDIDRMRDAVQQHDLAPNTARAYLQDLDDLQEWLAGNDGGLVDPAGSTAVSDLLFAGTVQCASCHNAHDNTNTSFLVASNDASALCLTCHLK